ncbi:MAG: hypothetical protein ACRDKJ_03345, partial [Actinomycetota bacterium]
MAEQASGVKQVDTGLESADREAQIHARIEGMAEKFMAAADPPVQDLEHPEVPLRAELTTESSDPMSQI